MFKFMSLTSSLQSLRNIYYAVASLLWLTIGGLGFAYRVPGDFCPSTVPSLRLAGYPQIISGRLPGVNPLMCPQLLAGTERG